MKMSSTSLFALLVLVTLSSHADQSKVEKLPEGPGISAKYPNDANISKDTAVIFADDFESGYLKKWDDKSGTIAITDEKPHGGKKCVTAPMEQGKSTGGEAKKWFMPGADRVFARTYVKFSDDYQYAHHFLTLLANEKKNRWASFGKAGLKPDGKTWFCSGMEPWFAWGKNPSPGEVNFYSYFMDMEIDPKMNKYWGNGYFPPGPQKGKAAAETRVIPKLGQWQCWEFMIQANTPGKADGRQAMWLDGKLVGAFEGIRWRADADLKINCFWLQHYGYDGSDPTKGTHKEKQTVWFDDVVVAKEYIGPRVEEAGE
jgi:hypothetical protein